MNLTLNDFRSVLGIKNDGNVVMKLDQSGIEKANYGNFFANWFRKGVRTAPSNYDENVQIRQALLVAINNSSEGKALSSDDIERIYAALGMNGAGVADFYAPLTRRELKNVIDIIDRATEGDKLVDKAVESLRDMDLLDENVAGGVKSAMNSAPCFNPPAKSADRVAAARALFGAVDRKLAENVKVLSEADYNALILQAQQLDAESGVGVHEVEKAVEALRKSSDIQANVT